MQEFVFSGQKKVKLDMIKSPLELQVLHTYNKARACKMTLPHGVVQTPVYMPVGTKGTIKGLTSKEMEHLDCKILLGNTYHLAFTPGGDFLTKAGGLHKFMNWKYNILTDSGGFQMVSLSKLCEITEEGVEFSSPVDGSKMFLRPEDSMYQQNGIGGDIMMALDDVVKTTTTGPRVEEACDRTTRWIDRCIQAHAKPESQNLFGIVQGGLNPELRIKSMNDLIARDLPGYAIGGLSGGEAKDQFWKIVHLCTNHLPSNKPRYLMGVGYPVDLIVCSCLGVDMFDCVFSTRTARFGTAFTKYGFLKLGQAKMITDMRPIEDDCGCQTCKSYSRSYLNSMVQKEEIACHLISIHNLYYLLNLMKSFRQSVIDENVNQFVNNFIKNQFIEEKQIPQWVQDALQAAKIDLNVVY